LFNPYHMEAIIIIIISLFREVGHCWPVPVSFFQWRYVI
jgi:hypothetical protein